MAKRGLLLFLVLPVLTACQVEEEAFELPARVAIPPEAVVVSFGQLSDTTGVEVMTWVDLAALSESGCFLAVGDFAPPFLRILDRETGIARVFGMEGGGPGELSSANAIDFLGDSILLVLSTRQRLDRFSTTGEWLGGDPLSETKVQALSIAVGCGVRIFIYGVPFDHRQLDPVPWVHELTTGGGLSVETRLKIPGVGYRVLFGRGGLHGFDGNDEGIVIWHRAREPQVGYWLPCDGAEPDLWSHQESREVIERTMELEGAEVGGSVLTLPDTLFQGVAVLGSMKVRAWRALEPDDGIAVTSVRVAERGRCREVEILGEWTLFDAHQEGLVLATSDPFPSVQVIDWGWLDSVLSEVRCGI